jgi:hypothetical protein
MKNKYFSAFLLASIILFSFLSWLSVDRAINVPASSVWLVPIAFFSLYFIALCLAMIFIQNRAILNSVIFLSLFSSLFFAFDWTRIIWLILAFLILFLAERRLKKEATLHIKINLRKIVGAVRALIVLALAIMIASQYYSEIKNWGMRAMLPKIELGQKTAEISSGILSMFNPNFQNLNDKNITVDQFILETQFKEGNSQEEQNKRIDQLLSEEGKDLTPEQKEEIKSQTLGKIDNQQKEMILEQGRLRLSEIAGRDVLGNEKIANVFQDIVNNKINSVFQPNVSGEANPALPMIFSIALFLTIFSLGGFVSYFNSLIIGLIFLILVKKGVVTIKKIEKEVEMIDS